MSQSELIKNLLNPYLYSHPVQYFKVIETHISWIILTGQYVYKIKKPVNLEFLDFSTLENRHHFCLEEIRLNRALAPEIYLDVVSIHGSTEHPSINSSGPAIEYAVHMREFPQTALFDYLLSQNKLTKKLIDRTAEKLAAFHLRTAICPETEPYGTSTQVHEPVLQNFEQIYPLLQTEEDKNQLQTIEQWAHFQHQKLLPLLTRRKQEGYIRECHGDVHLGNIALIHREPVIFDCIEFNTAFRWTDVMADPGFLAMDLEDQNKPRYANRLINHYLRHTGDYSGLHVLNYYKSYRAIVRAKVALFQRMQANSEIQQEALLNKYRRCIQLAHRYTQTSSNALIIMHGLSASGKSTIAQLLVDKLSYFQISSDIERKRLAGLDMLASSHMGVCEGLYNTHSTEKTYQRLHNLAKEGLLAEKTIIVDASFLKLSYRQLFKSLADSLKIPFIILDCQVTLPLLRQRLTLRQQKKNQISEAYQEVLTMQSLTEDSLTPYEKEYSLTINMESFNSINAIIPLIKNLKKKQSEISLMSVAGNA